MDLFGLEFLVHLNRLHRVLGVHSVREAHADVTATARTSSCQWTGDLQLIHPYIRSRAMKKSYHSKGCVSKVAAMIFTSG